MGIDFKINEPVEIVGDVDEELYKAFLAKLAAAMGSLDQAEEDYSDCFAITGLDDGYANLANDSWRGSIQDYILWLWMLDICVLKPNGWSLNEQVFTYRSDADGISVGILCCVDAEHMRWQLCTASMPGGLNTAEFSLSEDLLMELVGQLSGKVPVEGCFVTDEEQNREFGFFAAGGKRIAIPRQAPPADYLSGAKVKQFSDFIRIARDWLKARRL